MTTSGLGPADDHNELAVCLSGGGVRAALFSGGCLLALQEASRDGSARVGSVHAISGSALLLASLLLAAREDEGAERPTGRDQAELLRTEIERINREGFVTPSYAVRMALGIAIGLGLTALWLAVTRLLGDRIDGGDMPGAVEGAATVVAALIFIGLVVAMQQRSVPFRIRPPRRSVARFFQPRHGDEDHAGFPNLAVGFLPSDRVQFGATRVTGDELEPAWLDAVGQGHGASTVGERAGLTGPSREPLVAYLGRASAAYPLFSRQVEIDGEVYADGGLTDNLGLSGALATEATSILSIDASTGPTFRAPDRYRVSKRRWLMRPVALWVASMIAVVGVVFGLRSLGLDQADGWLVAVVLLWGLASSLLGLFIVLVPVYEGVRNSVATVGVEVGTTAQLLATQSAFWRERAGSAGVDLTTVSLRKQLDDELRCPVHGPSYRTSLRPPGLPTGPIIIEAGYLQTCAALGREPSDTSREWLEGLSSARWQSRLTRAWHDHRPRLGADVLSCTCSASRRRRPALGR